MKINYDTMIAYVYSKDSQFIINSSYEYNSRSWKTGKLITSEKRFHYLIYTKGNIYGSLFDKNSENKKVLIDSILKTEWIYGFTKIDEVLSNNLSVLIAEIKEGKSQVLHKIFSVKNKSDTSITAQVDLYFSKSLKLHGYSLSEELEEKEQQKLFKIHIINNPRIMENGIKLDRIDQEWSIEEVPINNLNEIRYFFEVDKRNNM